MNVGGLWKPARKWGPHSSDCKEQILPVATVNFQTKVQPDRPLDFGLVRL